VELPSLRGQGMIAVDLETCDPELQSRGCGAHRAGTHIAGVAVGTEAGHRGYYPVGHEAGPNLPREQVMGWLREQMALDVPKVGAYLQYDVEFMAAEGIEVRGPLYDVQNAEPLLCETRFSYGLDEIARAYLGEGKRDRELDEYLKLQFKRKKKSELKTDIWRCPPSLVGPYAEADVDLPLRVFKLQRAELERQGLWDLFVLESKLIPTLAAMRRRGVRVDLDKAEQMDRELGKRYAELLSEISKVAGAPVSVWAAKSLAKVFDAVGLAYGRTPKTDAPSITADWLEEHEHSHPVAGMVLEARKLDKLRGTFLQGCILEGHYRGRLHCNFNQLRSENGGAVSGRFSSSKPNLQFIPTRTEMGKEIRKIFLADLDQDWAKADYNQIEFRLIVHDAVERGLPGAREVADQYREDPSTDFHQVVAEMAGISRTFGKTINFGLAYGEGVVKLASQLGLSIGQADELLSQYHSRVPFVRKLLRQFMDEAEAAGIVRTLLNRIRRFDRWALRRRGDTVILDHRVPGSSRAFTHKALNARVQGSAADVMKKAMVDIAESGACEVLGVPHLTVHDELDFSVPRTKEGYEAVREVKRAMETCVGQLAVPLTVDMAYGPSWGECAGTPERDAAVPSSGHGGGISSGGDYRRAG